MNILLVDDNEELREALAKLLVQRGHMVTHAAHGLQAMSAVHHAIDPYDAMLTDYAMPNMTGVELAQCVQKNSPSTRIAIMSGDASIADRVPAGIPFLKKGLFGYNEIAQALHLGAIKNAAQSLTFFVQWAGERNAGIRAGNEEVSISFKYGGNDLNEDAVEHFRQCVQEFFDGSIALTQDEYDVRVAKIDSLLGKVGDSL